MEGGGGSGGMERVVQKGGRGGKKEAAAELLANDQTVMPNTWLYGNLAFIHKNYGNLITLKPTLLHGGRRQIWHGENSVEVREKWRRANP